MKGQDILVVLKLVSSGPEKSYAELSEVLGMSASEAHAAIRRLIQARLLDPNKVEVNRERLLQFLIHGVSCVFPVSMQGVTRGLPTAWGAPVFQSNPIMTSDMPPVWVHPTGSVRGYLVKPLYKSAVHAALRDRELYDLLSLVDALRIGRARERRFAEQELEKRLKGRSHDSYRVFS